MVKEIEKREKLTEIRKSDAENIIPIFFVHNLYFVKRLYTDSSFSEQNIQTSRKSEKNTKISEKSEKKHI